MPGAFAFGLGAKVLGKEEELQDQQTREKNRGSSAAMGLGGMMRNADGWAVERCCLLGDRGAVRVPCLSVGPRRAQLDKEAL